MAPSHYLNQWWNIVNCVNIASWYSLQIIRGAQPGSDQDGVSSSVYFAPRERPAWLPEDAECQCLPTHSRSRPESGPRRWVCPWLKIIQIVFSLKIYLLHVNSILIPEQKLSCNVTGPLVISISQCWFMFWCHQATIQYSLQCWPSFRMPCGVTQNQWVNAHSNEVC